MAVPQAAAGMALPAAGGRNAVAPATVVRAAMAPSTVAPATAAGPGRAFLAVAAALAVVLFAAGKLAAAVRRAMAAGLGQVGACREEP